MSYRLIHSVKKKIKHNGEICRESIKEVSARITAILVNILKLREKQEAVVFETLMNMLNNESCTEDKLQELYEELNKQNKNNSAVSAAQKLYKVSNLIRFTNNDTGIWENIIQANTGRFTVFQLSDLDDNTKKFAAELILDDLIKHINLNGNRDNPFILVLDELQKLNTNEGSSIGKLLTESRKYGASLWYATQFSDFNKKNNVIQNQLHQAGTRIYLKPADSEIGKLARQFENKRNSNDKNGFDWKLSFDSMQKGCCVVKSSLTKNDEDKLVIIGSFDTPYTRTPHIVYEKQE